MRFLFPFALSLSDSKRARSANGRSFLGHVERKDSPSTGSGRTENEGFKADSGFTLVEMLVALALFAMMAVIGVGLLRGSIDTQGAVQSRLAAMSGINRLRAIMGHDLTGAVPRMTRSAAGTPQPAFLGSPTGFAFVQSGGSDLDNGPQPDLQRVGYALVGDEWRRASQPMLDGTALGEGNRLIGDVSSVSIRYRDAQGLWKNSWNSGPYDQLPAAVEVTLTRTARAPLLLRFLVAPSPLPPQPATPPA